MNWTYRIEPGSLEDRPEPFYGFRFFKTLTDSDGSVVVDAQIKAEEFKAIAPQELVSGFGAFAIEYLAMYVSLTLTPTEETGNIPNNISPFSLGIAAEGAAEAVREFLR